MLKKHKNTKATNTRKHVKYRDSQKGSFQILELAKDSLPTKRFEEYLVPALIGVFHKIQKKL
jgi:hypothetical protein